MKTIFIDCETTGTDPAKHGLIQIAGALFKDKALVEQFDFKMAPGPLDVIEEEALQINRHTREELLLWPNGATTYGHFTTMLGKHCDKFDRSDKIHFVGYNADFDSSFVRRWFEKCGDQYFGSWFFWPILDVSKLAGIRLMKTRASLRDFKLMTVARFLNLITAEEADAGAHDALFDIKVTMKLFKVLTKDLALFDMEGL